MPFANIAIRLRLICFVALFTVGFAHAQTPDWSTSVASIIYTNCSSCHRPGTAAPFSLLSYEDAVAEADDIQEAVVDKFMPPWPADPSYRHFAHEAVLSANEIQAIDDWVNAGMPLGDTSLEPPAPVFSDNGSQLDTIDYTVAIPPYTLQSNADEYRWFVIPTTFSDTVYVNRIEVIPGTNHVHHADLAYDITGNSMANDVLDPLPGFNGSTGGPTYSYYMNAWMAGGNVATFPPNWGIMVPPGADFVVEIHYGPGAIGTVDSTRMNLQFVTNPSQVRPVSAQWLLGHNNMTDGPLVIPANEIKTFHQASAPLATDKSVVAICPHMHLLGQSYRVWYKTAAGDSVPLINIPKWDFHWQMYYTFPTVEKIPAGAVVYSEGVYDNTAANLHNPHFPPQTVTAGLTTTSEMFMTYFILADYKPGDEEIVMDTTWFTAVETGAPESGISVFPNPANAWVQVQSALVSSSTLVVVTNVLGQPLIRMQGNDAGVARFDVARFAPGCYFATVVNQESTSTVPFVIAR